MNSTFKKNTDLFLKELNHFNYELDYNDYIWKCIFPDIKNKWHYVFIRKYNKTFYITHVNSDSPSLEINDTTIQAAPSFSTSYHDTSLEGLESIWNDIINSLLRWFKIIKKDWVKANKLAHQSYPLKYRSGIISNSLIRSALSDIYRIDKQLGKSKTKKFIDLIESGNFYGDKKIIFDSMSANDFFNYCKIAYIAGKRKDDVVDENLTGRQMYERYADGRHEGLLEIDPSSPQEFADWIDDKHPLKQSGGHPWEIKRGGNTTHIDLYVTRPAYQTDGFVVRLCGPSIGRLQETVSMFLAIHDAGLPIGIFDPEGIRKRLLGQDNIGIVPSFDSLHRANQRFPKIQDVYDVMHFDDLGRSKRTLIPFITWEPLPLLIPRKNS